MRWRPVVLIAVSGVLAAPPSAGAPFTPDDDRMVLESGLPTTDPRMREIRVLGREARDRPGDLGIALRLASRQLAMGVAEADPRFVGYAQAALAPWWDDPAPTVALRLLRARVRQAQHDFDGAAVEARAVLHEDPANADALLLLAAVAEVSGNLDEAEAACRDLERTRPGVAATACLASIGSLSGNAPASYRALADAVTATSSRDTALRVWALTILAEIAARLDYPDSERWFEAARTLDGRNVYVLTAEADYLLDHGWPGEVTRMLRGFERIDALFLRLTLALKAVGDPRFPDYRDDLAARYAAAQRQGDRLHLRDASRFALEIEGDADRALGLAQTNWATHKAPADAKVLLAAAIAGGNPSAVKSVAEWVGATHLEDRTITRLLQQQPSPERPGSPTSR